MAIYPYAIYSGTFPSRTPDTTSTTTWSWGFPSALPRGITNVTFGSACGSRCDLPGNPCGYVQYLRSCAKRSLDRLGQSGGERGGYMTRPGAPLTRGYTCRYPLQESSHVSAPYDAILEEFSMEKGKVQERKI